jgi:phosphocarrier protein FPr/phosphocarrier protein
MMGDGVAIDPTGTSLHAPCDGTLVVVPASKHAVTIRAENGAEILLHVGIDTVGLAGEGFELHVREGQTVRAGDRLISFDLDLLARRAKSLITPVLVTDTMGFTISRRSQNCSLRVGDFLMEVLQTADIANADPAAIHPGASRADANAAHAAAAGATQPGLVERSVLVLLEHGIHARPAATLAAVAKKLNANINIAFGERKANAKSPVALMTLGVRKGDHIVIQASGADAEAAVAALEQAIAGGKDSHAGAATLAVTGGAASAASARRPASLRSGVPHPGASTTSPPSDAPQPGPPTTSLATATPRANGTPGGSASNSGAPSVAEANAAARAAATPSDRALKGVVASRGLGVGTAFQFARAAIEVPELGAGAPRESSEFDRARETVRADLERSVSSNNSAAREIAEAHLGLIDDPELIDGARALIEKGKSAGYAWRAVLRDGIEQLRALNDPRMAERAYDLLDLETRVLSALSGDTGAGPNFPPESILITSRPRQHQTRRHMPRSRRRNLARINHRRRDGYTNHGCDRTGSASDPYRDACRPGCRGWLALYRPPSDARRFGTQPTSRKARKTRRRTTSRPTRVPHR